MPSIPLTAQQIENNKKNAPQLPDHIKPYEEMGYDWVRGDKTIIRVGIDIAGNLLAYCHVCDKYYPFEEMSADATRPPCGIKPKCKRCENSRQRDAAIEYNLKKQNGAARLQNNTITNPITETTTRLSCQAALEEKWNKSNKDITLEGLRKMGLTDKHFIYIRRWFDIPDEIKKEIEEKTQSPNIGLYYVGQTNGRDLDYNGSGSNLKTVEELVKNVPDIREEIRIIEIVNPDQVNRVECETIGETGAAKYGLNILTGPGGCKKISYTIKLDFSQEQDMKLHLTLLEYSKQCGWPIEELIKNMACNGVTAYQQINTTFAETAFSGDIEPMMNCFKQSLNYE